MLDLMPWSLGPVLRGVYLRQIKSAPGSWGHLLDELERHEAVANVVSSFVGAAAPRIERLAQDGSSSGFVSTHPFASQALGSLRAAGRLRVPAVTYLTDMSVHRLWVHPGVDLHLALHELPAAAAKRHAAGAVQVVQPAVPSRFSAADRSPRQRLRLRSALGLPGGARLALVTGGAYGIGDLEHAAMDVAATGVATPLVMCGHNQQLRRRLQRHDGIVALGWVDDVVGFLGGVDVVIQNAGGFTSLESLATGVPVLTYRCLPGHGEANAAVLERAGLVPWLRGVEELSASLVRAGAPQPNDLAAPSVSPPDVATAIIDLVGRERRTPDLVPA